MAQPFNSRQSADENSIIVPDVGLLQNAPRGGYPPGALPTLTNLYPNYRGQLETRPGTDVILTPQQTLPLGDGSLCLESYPLTQGFYVLVYRMGLNLRTYLYDPSERRAVPYGSWDNVWPLRCASTKMNSTVIGNCVLLTCTKMVPIVVRVEELTFTPSSTTVQIPDLEEKWRYSEPRLVFWDGTVYTPTIVWNVAPYPSFVSFTIPASMVGTEVHMVSTTWHWACGGKRYYGNQLYREQMRFNSDPLDTTLQTPASLLTNKVVARNDTYPFILGKPARQTYYTPGTTEASVAGSAITYKWTSGAHVFDGGASTKTPPSPEACTFGALEAGGNPSTLRYFRLVEVNATVPDIVVLVQENEDADLQEYSCSATVLGAFPSLSPRTYVPYQDATGLALGNMTTTVYKYIAFDGEDTPGLNKEAVAWVLVRPALVDTSGLFGPHVMQYHPHKNGTLFPAPGSTTFTDGVYGPGTITQYGQRVVLGQYRAYPGVVVASGFVKERRSVTRLDFYGEEYGLERLSTDPYVLEVNLDRGQRVTGLCEYLQNLMVFTDSSTWRVHGGQGAPASPLSVVIENLYALGAYNSRCVSSAGDTVIFYGRSGVYRIFYRDQTYQLEPLGLPLMDSFYFRGDESLAWVCINSWTNTVYVSPESGPVYGYSMAHEMWYRLEHGRRSPYTYGVAVVDGVALWPGVATQTPGGTASVFVIADNSPRGHYLDYYMEITSGTGQKTYNTGLDVLLVPSSGVWRDEDLPFYNTPYGTSDIDGGSSVAKQYWPSRLILGAAAFKRAGATKNPLGVFVNGTLQVEGTHYTVDSSGVSYVINFVTAPPPSSIIGYGYTYPQVVEVSPLTRSTLLRSKQTRVVCALLGPTPEGLIQAPVNISAYPRSESYTKTAATVQVEFTQDASLRVASATVNVDGVLPTVYIWKDFSPSGFVLDSYQVFVEPTERRTVG